jgi:hypothetical protein
MPKGPKGQKRPADMNQLAKAIVDIATGERQDDVSDRNGSAGGKVGGQQRAKALSAEDRSRIAKKAADTRWHKGSAKR